MVEGSRNALDKHPDPYQVRRCRSSASPGKLPQYASLPNSFEHGEISSDE